MPFRTGGFALDSCLPGARRFASMIKYAPFPRMQVDIFMYTHSYPRGIVARPVAAQPHEWLFQQYCKRCLCDLLPASQDVEGTPSFQIHVISAEELTMW